MENQLDKKTGETESKVEGFCFRPFACPSNTYSPKSIMLPYWWGLLLGGFPVWGVPERHKPLLGCCKGT